jgi:hypothetical protein
LRYGEKPLWFGQVRLLPRKLLNFQRFMGATMRVIERQINNIVEDFQKRMVTGACQRTKRDRIVSENGNVSCYLWGTRIADVTTDKITLRSGGYRTSTTKSRLNALLRLTGRNLSIYQKNFVWHVYDGALCETVEFHDGIAFDRFI